MYCCRIFMVCRNPLPVMLRHIGYISDINEYISRPTSFCSELILQPKVLIVDIIAMYGMNHFVDSCELTSWITECYRLQGRAFEKRHWKGQQLPLKRCAIRPFLDVGIVCLKLVNSNGQFISTIKKSLHSVYYTRSPLRNRLRPKPIPSRNVIHL